MADLSVADITQQYANCVILYKGKICKVKQVGAQIKLLNLRTQRTSSVDFSLKDFSPPVLRLGYVNMDGGAIYVSRRPVRMFMSGLTSANCLFTTNRKASYPTGVINLKDKLSYMECPEFADMMLDHYPSLKKAVDQAKDEEGNIAFDKQFAVDCYKNIYYKGVPVGSVNEDEKIVFNKEYEYLSCLLGDGYEKATRTFAQVAD